MSTTSLSRRRKQELKEVAQSLGITDDGTREDLVERIKHHVSTSGDASLASLLREDTPDRSGNNSRRSSLDGVTTTTTSTKTSPRKKITITETTTTKTNGGGKTTTTHLHANGGLSENQVSNFMDHMQDELHDAKDLAKELEDTLHKKFSTGNSSRGKSTVTSTTSTTSRSSGRRGSSSRSHPLDSGHASHASHGHEDTDEDRSRHLEHRSARIRRSSHHVEDDEDEPEGRHHRRGSHSSRHDHDAHVSSHSSRSHRHGHHHKGGLTGWWNHLTGEIQHRFAHCGSHGGACRFSTCLQNQWKRLHDLGSTSKGFVWLTLLLELGVFLSQAYSYFHQNHHQTHDHSGSGQYNFYHDWMPSWIASYFTTCWVPHCLSFLTNWPHFLQPFFSYYGTLFLLPTLLSQLFNVDRAAHSSSSSDSASTSRGLTGLLAKKTTSGLSYFVFKFSLTYFLGHSAGLRSILGSAPHGGGHGAKGLWSGCKYVAEVFRYVPPSLGLATSGAGTVLALAESIVQAGRKK
ncbi:hypothetical protein BGZ83_003303 [Gryganskiella cystojenkinii]|nr:hypothetical protein BGZ83_003303 [Gryganskiella cystojenkinii]